MAATQAAPAPTKVASVVAASDVLTDYDQEAIDKFDATRSYEHIRELAVEIGPRLNGTPQEREGAYYIGGVLKSYGFKVKYQEWGPVSTKNVAKVTSSNADLPGGPNWQMSASVYGKFTGDSGVTGDVVYAGTGRTDEEFVTDPTGKIVLMEYTYTGSSSTTRTAAANNAMAKGAKAVIFGQTETGTSAPPTVTMTTGTLLTIPVLGGGSAHTKWIKDLLAQGPLTLRVASNQYVTPMGINVIAKRTAVGDPDGTTAPIVMVGAHIDSVLGAPGAHDDASGNGVSLEIARVLKDYPLDKELRIGGFGGEESGLLGAKAYAATITPEEKARFVGEWQMDMVGTPYEPAKLWALTPDGKTSFTVDEAYKAAARFGYDGLQNCRLGQSDHQAFFDKGIPSSLFIWLDYRVPTGAGKTCENANGSYVTEPQYHRPTDTMDNISVERLQLTLDVIGGAVVHNALNKVTITAESFGGSPLGDADVTANCGDGDRDLGQTSSDEADLGELEAVLPHATCSFTMTSGTATASMADVDVHGNPTQSDPRGQEAQQILLKVADKATPTVDFAVTPAEFTTQTTGAADITVAVPAGAGASAEGGLVEVVNGTDVIGEGAVDEDGTATVEFTRALAGGQQELLVRFLGTETVAAAESDVQRLDVRLDPQATTTVKMKVTPATITTSTRAWATVTVAVPKDPGASVEDGTVEIVNGTKVIGTGTVSASGTAKVRFTRTMAAGTQKLQARFLGTESVAPAVSSTTSVMVKSFSRMSVSMPKSITTKTKVKTTVTVKVDKGASAFGGAVYIYDGSKTVAKGKITSKGTVKLTFTKKLSKGEHRLTVRYYGTKSTTQATKVVTVKVKK